MATAHEAALRCWLAEPLPPEVRAALERLARTPGVVGVCAMPDVHLAMEVCVGTVAATKGVLLPGAVGGDIGCGMAALAFAGDAEGLRAGRDAARVMKALYRRIPANRHAQAAALPADLLAAPLSDAALERWKGREARVQLGTLGRGNHFVELQVDGEGGLWVMLHSGSRGIGQAIYGHHRPCAERAATGLLTLAADSAAGHAYLNDMAWARAYARANREAMLRAVTEILAELFGMAPVEHSLIHTDHNHVQEEIHEGVRLLVHRKGAVHAPAQGMAVIPGSMGTASFHVMGRGCAAALESCAHGAGRRLTRGEARARISSRAFMRQMEGVYFDARHAGEMREEAPEAYKDIHRVLRAQHELVAVVRELRPVLAYKGK